MKVLCAWTVCALMLVALPACGSDGTGGGGFPPFDSGHPDETLLAELSVEETIAMCEAYDVHFASSIDEDGLHQYECTLEGVIEVRTGGGDEEGCEERSAACLDEPFDEGRLEDYGPKLYCEAVTSPPVMCTATVGDAEACLDSRVVRYNTGLSNLAGYSCGEWLAETAEDPESSSQTPACQALLDQGCDIDDHGTLWSAL